MTPIGRPLLLAVLALLAASAGVWGQAPRRLEADPLPDGAVLRLGSNRLRLSSPPGYLVFSPDDSILMVGSAEGVRFLDAKTWGEVWRLDALAFSVSPDNIHVARLTPDRTLEIWDHRAKKMVQRRTVVVGPREPFRPFDIEFDSTGDSLWIGLSGQGAMLFNWRKNETTHRIDAADVMESSLCQSRDRKVIALRRHSGQVSVYNGATAKLVRNIKIEPQTWDLALNHDGGVLSVSAESRTKFVDVATGKPRELTPRPAKSGPGSPDKNPPEKDKSASLDDLFKEPDDDGVRSRPLFTKSGDRLLMVGSASISVVDLMAKKILVTEEHDQLFTFALSGDDSLLAVGTLDGAIEIRDARTLKPVVDDPHPRGAALSLAFTADGQSLLTHHDGKSVVLRSWSLKDGSLGRVKTLDVDRPLMPRGLVYREADRLALLWTMPWNPVSGNRVKTKPLDGEFVASSRDGARWLIVEVNEVGDLTAMKVIDSISRRPVAALPNPAPREMPIPAASIVADFSTDGGHVAVLWRPASRTDAATGNLVTFPGAIDVWNVSGQRPTSVFQIPIDHSAAQFELSPDGQFLALRSGSDVDESDISLQVWHVPTGVLLWKSADDGGASFESRRSSSVAEAFIDRWGGVLAFSPDNRVLAFSQQGNVVLRETLTGDVVQTFSSKSGESIADLAFSPDRRLLASASLDSTVLVWKLPRLADGPTPAFAKDHAEAIWNDLKATGPDAQKAMAALFAGGDAALAEIAPRLRLLRDDERSKIVQSLADLASPQFRVREKAMAALSTGDFRVKPYVADALARASDLEQKRRLVSLFERLRNAGVDAEEVRLGRLIGTLDEMQSPAARVMLESIARGHDNDLAVRAARAALLRRN